MPGGTLIPSTTGHWLDEGERPPETDRCNRQKNQYIQQQIVLEKAPLTTVLFFAYFVL